MLPKGMAEVAASLRSLVKVSFNKPSTTSHLNVVVHSPFLYWGGSKWLVDSPKVSSSGDSLSDNSFSNTEHRGFNSFEAKKKAGAVFIDLTAAYDTVWHRGLTCKLLILLPDKHMAKMIIELVRNRSFTLTTGDSKQSRLRRLKNGVPQGSVLAPLLFNIYTYDLPSMISRKFAYADDLALLHSSGNWKDLEETLSQDMSTLSAYLQTWRLKLSHTKTVAAAFHLNNREAKRELKVYNNGRLLPFCPTPTYLGVKLDRSLTFRHHLVALRKKLSSLVTLLRRLVGSEWGAGAKTLCIATLSLVYSTAEYCAPVWYHSAHTRLIDSVLNDALNIVTGCLRPTPTDHLPVLSGIQPAELRRLRATLCLAHRRSLDPDHILYGLLSKSSDTGQVRLRSRRPFVPAARNLLDNLARLGIINGKRNTMKMLPGSVLLCPRPVPGLLGWAYPEQLGLGSTACGLVLGDSIRPCTNGVSLLHRIASVAPLSKPQTMY